MTKLQLTALRSKLGVGLDLGCGGHKQDGFFGVDARHIPGVVDLVCDLEKFPWDLPDNCAHTVVMSHFWEHIKPWMTIRFMEELHRVCKPGARVLISAPYGLGFRFVQDPTHCNPTNEATFAYFDPQHDLYGVYRPKGTFSLAMFERVPVGGDSDFNAILICLKEK